MLTSLLFQVKITITICLCYFLLSCTIRSRQNFVVTAFILHVLELHSRFWFVFLFPAPTTVNVTHRPVTQTAAKLPIPRTPTNHQVVYTTIPAPPAQNSVRGAVMPSPSLRPVNPQTGSKGFFLAGTFQHSTASYILLNGSGLFCVVVLFGFVLPSPNQRGFFASLKT